MTFMIFLTRQLKCSKGGNMFWQTIILGTLLLLTIACTQEQTLEDGALSTQVPLFVQQQPDPYLTPSGYIKKGYTKAEIKRMLGEPAHAAQTSGQETWYYFFDDNNRVAVDFFQGEVAKVSNKEVQFLSNGE